MQNYTAINALTRLTDSLSLLLNNDLTAISQSSGTVFPTSNLQVGMPCYRTDQKKLYLLADLAPTWVLFADLGRIPLWQGDVSGLFVDASNVYLAVNASLGTTGTWTRNDTSKQATVLALNIAGTITMYSASAGSNPISAWDQVNAGKVWTSANQGQGSGLDADTLDGHQAADFVLSAGSLLTPYPVGSIYISANSTFDPNQYFGGTWTAFGTGQVLVGYDSTQTEFSPVGKTGGEKAHTLTIPEMPAHSHTYDLRTAELAQSGSSTPCWFGDVNANTGTTGGSQPHNNLQPYIVVKMWQRTA